jgi:hypothetical protein
LKAASTRPSHTMARVQRWRCRDRRIGSTPPRARRGRHEAKELASTRKGDRVSSPRGARAAPTRPRARAATRRPQPSPGARRRARPGAPRAHREGAASTTRSFSPTTQGSRNAAAMVNRLRSSQKLAGAICRAPCEMFPPGYGHADDDVRRPPARSLRRQRAGPLPGRRLQSRGTGERSREVAVSSWHLQ